MAEKWGLEREALDDFAYQSHLRAMQAIQAGRFESQILPVDRPDGRMIMQMKACACRPIVRRCARSNRFSNPMA